MGIAPTFLFKVPFYFATCFIGGQADWGFPRLLQPFTNANFNIHCQSWVFKFGTGVYIPTYVCFFVKKRLTDLC
ncbi:hypothetical protein F4819DRAFT_413965 [Hypoxylon fuscum]|nr:hypothetical protein F4819DRAFT_413965 [Hypoxylon fuscum]